MRVITIEEDFHHPESVARVPALSGSPSSPGNEAGCLPTRFTFDVAAAERLGGARLAHMDSARIDVQVVSHGANSPGSLDHPKRSICAAG